MNCSFLAGSGRKYLGQAKVSPMCTCRKEALLPSSSSMIFLKPKEIVLQGYPRKLMRRNVLLG
jgi:hypothetical protein